MFKYPMSIFWAQEILNTDSMFEFLKYNKFQNLHYKIYNKTIS